MFRILGEALDLLMHIDSHYHFDHLGDPSRFPSSTEIVVGPKFKKAFLPGYPTGKQSPVRESDFRCAFAGNGLAVFHSDASQRTTSQ